MATCEQILRVTSSLSPVRTFTVTPLARSAAEGWLRGLLRRIEERDVADQHEIGLVILRVSRVRWSLSEILGSDGEHAKPVGAQRVVFLAERVEEGWFGRQHRTVILERLAAPEDLLRRSFREQLVVAIRASRRRPT